MACGSYNTGTVTKVTDAHAGAYAAKLSTLSLPTNSGGSTTVPGLLVLGAKAAPQGTLVRQLVVQ